MDREDIQKILGSKENRENFINAIKNNTMIKDQEKLYNILDNFIKTGTKNKKSRNFFAGEISQICRICLRDFYKSHYQEYDNENNVNKTPKYTKNININQFNVLSLLELVFPTKNIKYSRVCGLYDNDTKQLHFAYF